jgi:hypothetical protein
MKMKSPANSFLMVLIALAATLVACGPSKEKKEDGSDEFSEAEKSMKEQITDVVYNIPSPTEIPYLLAATGAEYNASLINDKKKAASYGSKTEKAALNLGVYTADIGYLTSYEKTQDAIDYINTCKTLAENLGVMGSFDIEVMKQFEANVSNKDSLASLLNQTLQKADKYLKDDSRNKLAALIVTGSFVEGLYISTGLIKTYPKDLLPADKRNLILTPLMRIILDQRKSVGELLNVLGTVDQSEPVATLIKDLTALQTSYNALNIEEQIKNNRSDLVLTDKNLADITARVEKLRADITQ